MLRKTAVVFATLAGLAMPARAASPLDARNWIKFYGAVARWVEPPEIARVPMAPLSPAEVQAARHFRKVRDAEIAGYKSSNLFPGGMPFYDGKGTIARSPTFTLLRRMPKGAALHIHSTAAGRAEWIVHEASYRPNCYVYWPAEACNGGFIKGQLGFYTPGKAPQGFIPVSQARRTIHDFDQKLLRLITLGSEDEDIPVAWAEFSNCFQRIGGLVAYQPVFVDYLADAFATLAEDGVDYVELRTGLGPLYDLEGHQWSGRAFLDQCIAARDIARKTYPNFDFKLIVSGWRGATIFDVWKQLLQMLPVRLSHPELVVGFDLVGEEDTGFKTAYYAGVLLFAAFLYDYLYDVDLPFYLHDGETNWREESNIRYALLLRSRRIGHGLNLHYFPRLEQIFRVKGVPLEVCPISNQMLRYIADIRLHPAGDYLRNGVACVISSDDPSIFGNEGLSFDFWEAALSWELGLAELKQLSKCSIHYSAMDPQGKREALARWQVRWDRFIKDVNAQSVAATAGDGRDAARPPTAPSPVDRLRVVPVPTGGPP